MSVEVCEDAERHASKYGGERVSGVRVRAVVVTASNGGTPAPCMPGALHRRMKLSSSGSEKSVNMVW